MKQSPPPCACKGKIGKGRHSVPVLRNAGSPLLAGYARAPMILRDPVHGLVTFESAEESVVPRLLEAREVQRLRRVRQLGLASLAYPGADHTRFSHAVGCAHVMTRLLARLRSLQGDLPYWQRATTERAREALAAALLHDLGHGPFSHLFEEAFPGAPRHETWTRRIVSDPGTEVGALLAALDPSLPGRVAALVTGEHELPWLARAVSGSFDVDRCDYLLRDAYFTGVSYGSFDLDWLFRSLCFAAPPSVGAAPALAVDGPKGLPAIESFVQARLFMFQQVYLHKAGRAAEVLLRSILSRVHALLADGARLERVPAAIRSLVSDGDAPLGEYLDLDDVALWGMIASFRDARDPILRDLAARLTARRLFKTRELFQEREEEVASLHEQVRELARRAGLDPDVYVALDVAEVAAFDQPPEGLKVRLPGGRAADPAEVSFLLGRLLGARMRRVRLVFAPELREAVDEALG